MKNRFYDLGPLWNKKYLWGQVDLDIHDPAFQNGMRGYKKTVSVKISSGTEPGDFIWNSHDLVIVSNKLLQLWSRMTKFETYSVIVEGLPHIPYTGIVITGRGGPFDPVRSKARYKSVNPSGPPSLMGIEGLFFDESKWDGTDLFALPDWPRATLATSRLVDEMKKHKISNCAYTPIENVRF